MGFESLWFEVVFCHLNSHVVLYVLLSLCEPQLSYL